MWHCNSSGEVKSDFFLSGVTSLGLTARLEQMLLLQLTSSGADGNELDTTQAPTASDQDQKISQVENPSGIWNSFITEEGSSDRGKRTVHYLCQSWRGEEGGRASKKGGLVHFKSENKVFGSRNIF